MINVLIIAICVMSLITVISSVVGTVILTKYTKSEKIVGKVLKIIGNYHSYRWSYWSIIHER